MKVHFTIIHELIKEEQKDKASTVLSEEVLDSNNEGVVKLVTELNERYASKGGKHSVFNDEKSEPFDAAFKTYAKKLTDEDAFIEFTAETTEELKSEIAKITPAKGGFMIFTYYEHHGSYVSVFIVRDKTGIQFERGKRRYNIKDAVHIDFEKMAMACRINIKLYKSGQSNYLSFIQSAGDDLSKYFIRWINASSNLNTDRDDTRRLLEVIRAMAIPLNEEGADQSEDIFHSNLHTYISSTPGRRVDLRDIGTKFYNDQEHLINYIEENAVPLSYEFRAHSSELKKLTRISAKADSIDLSFPHTAYKNKVRINNDETQVIISSKALVAKIKQNL